MTVSRSNTEYTCVNEREADGTVMMQGREVKTVGEFQYLQSTIQNNGHGTEEKKRV